VLLRRTIPRSFPNPVCTSSSIINVACVIAYFPDFSEILISRYYYTRFSLYGFKYDSSRVICYSSPDNLSIVVRTNTEGASGSNGCGIFSLCVTESAPRRPSVERMFCCDKFFFPAGFAGKFKCPFHSFGSGIAEEYPVHPCEIYKLLCQKRLLFGIIQVRDMYSTPCLPVNRFHDCGMAVSHVITAIPPRSRYTLSRLHQLPQRHMLFLLLWAGGCSIEYIFVEFPDYLIVSKRHIYPWTYNASLVSKRLISSFITTSFGWTIMPFPVSRRDAKYHHA